MPQLTSSSLLTFFGTLGRRRASENDLSDMTWAASVAAPDIGRAICAFFGLDVPPEYPLSVQREVVIADRCRVDLEFSSAAGTLFLENKKFDLNYHFADYRQAVAKCNRVVTLALISAHRLPAQETRNAEEQGWLVQYWDELATALGLASFGDSNTLAIGYLAYLNEVCKHMRIERIILDDATLVSLGYFHNLVKKIIETADHDSFVYKPYDRSGSGFGSQWFGRYYSLTSRTSSDTLWAFFGLFFGAEQPLICISVEDYANPQLRHVVRSRVSPSRGDWYEISADREGVHLELTAERYQAFREAAVTEQEQLLRDFFQRANRVLEALL